VPPFTRPTKLALTSLISVSIAAVCAAACGSDPPRKTLDADQFSSAYAQALCTSLKHCCNENAVNYDYVACTKGWKSEITKRFFALPDITYDPRTANDCIAKILAAETTSCEPTKGSVSDARDVCVSIFVGQKPVGAPCITAAECKAPPEGRVVCDTLTAGSVDGGGTLPLRLGILSTPVCTLINPTAPGEPCALAAGQVGVKSCGPALFCDPTSLQCRTRAQQGEACAAGGCVAGSYCATLASGATACAAFATSGGACTGEGQCDATSRCDVASRTCVPRKAPGEGCTSDADCQAGTCDPASKKCLKNSFATTAACTGQGY
jgi:hypothetical protein